MINSILVDCSKHDIVEDTITAPDITLEDVKKVITERGLELEEADLPSGNVFIQVLNGVSAEAYFIEGSTLSIYIFSTDDGSEKGKIDFEEKTVAASLEPYKTFTGQNVLIFYVEGSEENNNKLANAFNMLNEVTKK
ncbi:hypothetical protein SAMN04487944_11557 [Gracilibacillus ureilyticus]|uniref:Uncharacterized protein n=2 Tax=Gracilibacillus ureilyticus TaxID=531814 RepID=A0A1H9TXF0_9BACI|nr:hypothetical protein SAMN04487944_11557 [Gracilibacillus ureilyticus]